MQLDFRLLPIAVLSFIAAALVWGAWAIQPSQPAATQARARRVVLVIVAFLGVMLLGLVIAWPPYLGG
jgi:hypothetical protein